MDRIGGKIFRSSADAAAQGLRVLSEEEQADKLRRLEEWSAAREAAPADPAAPVPFGGRFSDDMTGTEYDADSPGYTDRERRMWNGE